MKIIICICISINVYYNVATWFQWINSAKLNYYSTLASVAAPTICLIVSKVCVTIYLEDERFLFSTVKEDPCSNNLALPLICFIFKIIGRQMYLFSFISLMRKPNCSFTGIHKHRRIRYKIEYVIKHITFDCFGERNVMAIHSTH